VPAAFFVLSLGANPPDRQGRLAVMNIDDVQERATTGKFVA
jgi:hypothetical protein